MEYNLRSRSRDGFPSASIAAQKEVQSQAPDKITASEAFEMLATVSAAEMENQASSESVTFHTTPASPKPTFRAIIYAPVTF